MKITEDVREYAREQGLDAEQALQEGMKAKSTEFQESGGELYRSAES